MVVPCTAGPAPAPVILVLLGMKRSLQLAQVSYTSAFGLAFHGTDMATKGHGPGAVNRVDFQLKANTHQKDLSSLSEETVNLTNVHASLPSPLER